MRLVPRTIRGRVAWTTFLLFAGVLSTSGFMIDRFDYHAALDSVDSRLEAEVEALASLTRFDGRKMEFDFQDEIITAFARPRCGDYFQISTATGLVESSRSLAGAALPAPTAADTAPLGRSMTRRTNVRTVPGPFEPQVRLFTLTVQRFVEHPEPNGDRRDPSTAAGVTVVVQVARSMAEVEGIWKSERVALLAGTTLALLLGTAGAFFVASRATRPIRDLTRDARAIASGADGSRLEAERIDGDLRALALLLNQAFDRLEAAIVRERRFASDAAHELRTPVTICRARLELALTRDRKPEEYRDAIRGALEASARIEGLISGLLLLTRAERPIDVHGVQDLGAIVATAINGLGAAAADPRQRVAFEPPPAVLLVAGHRELLERLVSGLVENAQRHGASPAGVTVVLNRDGTSARLEVLDRGPGFPDDLLPRLFDRFARGDASRSRATGGYGLGLAIARSIVATHGGTIVAGSRDGGGARIEALLPLVDPRSD